MSEIEYEVLKLRAEGLSIREIAKALGISKDKVYRILKKYSMTQPIDSKIEEVVKGYAEDVKERSIRLRSLIDEFYRHGDVEKLREIEVELLSLENRLRTIASLFKRISKELYEVSSYLASYVPSIRKAIRATIHLHSNNVVEALALWSAVYCGDELMLKKFIDHLTTYTKIVNYVVSRL